MISWLLVIILSYFFFSLAYLGDKLILSRAPKPNLYTFYVGALGALAIVFIPFIKFSAPDHTSLIWIVLEAIVYIAGLYTMFYALEKFEVSKVMTTIGATQPIIVLFLTWAFWGLEEITGIEIFAFFLLLAGSIIISFEKTTAKTSDYIIATILPAVFFSLDYIFQKAVFMRQPFWQGFILMRLASFLFVLVFFLSKKFRKEIFAKEKNIARDAKTGIIFICSQACGGLANALQSFAIFLVPVAFLAIVNALRGIQYVFLFLMTLFLSFLFPKILKEETGKSAIIQKMIAIIIIATGLALVVLY